MIKKKKKKRWAVEFSYLDLNLGSDTSQLCGLDHMI